MVITLLDEGTVRIQSGAISVVVDPQNDRVKPDVLLRTSTPYPYENPKPNEIVGPGEYEILGISIRGVQILSESKPDLIKTAYRATVEEITLGFMGEMASPPDQETLAALGDIDILFVPAGGKPYLGPESAAKLTKQIEPSIVIPLFAKRTKDFSEEMGQNTPPQEKLVIKKKDLIETGGGIRVICLSV